MRIIYRLRQLTALAALAIMLSPTTIVLAAGLPIGAECQTNADCAQNDCEVSKATDGMGNQKSFCDCSTAASCTAAYAGKPNDGGEWECHDGADATFDLDYCISSNKKDLRFSIPPKKGSFTDFLFDTEVAKQGLLDEALVNKPKLEIRIPGLNFNNTVRTTTDFSGNTYLLLPWIGEYIAAIYQFGLVVVSIVAVAVLIRHGFNIMFGGEFKEGSYKRIPQIIAGVLLLWGSYFLLYYINPALVNFKILKVMYIPNILLEDNHKCDDLKDCPELKQGPITKGKCASDKAAAQQNRKATVNFSLFGNVDGRTYGIRKLQDINMIIIHNGGYTAQGNNDTWLARPAGAHYTIQRDGAIYQHADEQCVMPHAPGGNATGIGIELNISKSGGKSCNALDGKGVTGAQILEACSPTAAQYASLKSLIDDIVSRTNVKISNNQIKGHCEVVGPGGHGDPRALDWTKIGLDNQQKKTAAQGHACSWYLPFSS